MLYPLSYEGRGPRAVMVLVQVRRYLLRSAARRGVRFQPVPVLSVSSCFLLARSSGHG